MPTGSLHEVDHRTVAGDGRMISAAVKMFAGALALLLLTGGTLYVRHLRTALADAQNQAGTAARGNRERDETIRRLRDDATDKARQQAELDTNRKNIATQLTHIQHKNRKLIDENPIAHSWALDTLPADVIRMQSNPALTGAGDYLARMPEGNALHLSTAAPAH